MLELERCLEQLEIVYGEGYSLLRYYDDCETCCDECDAVVDGSEIAHDAFTSGYLLGVEEAMRALRELNDYVEREHVLYPNNIIGGVTYND